MKVSIELGLAALLLIPLPAKSGPSAKSGPAIGAGFSRIELTTEPGLPIPHGQSAIGALTVAPNGLVYGATAAVSGKSFYLFTVGDDRIEALGNPARDLPRQERVVNALVVAADGTVYGGTTNYSEEEEVPDSYPGGHLFSFDPVTREISDAGIPVPGQGINCLIIDRAANRVYGLTYPRGHLLVWDVTTGKVEDKGATVPASEPVTERRGATQHRYLPRALALDSHGIAYGSRGGGYLWKYDPAAGNIELLQVKIPGAKGRETDWLYNHVADSFCLGSDGLIYGGTVADGYLFVFDPVKETVTNLGKPIRQSRIKAIGAGADGKIYALAGEEAGLPHLVAYSSQTRGFVDLGALGTSAWSVIYSAGTMVTHPSGKIYIGEAERISGIAIYDPILAVESMQNEE